MSQGKTWISAVVEAARASLGKYPYVSPLVSNLRLCKLFLKAKICSSGQIFYLTCPEFSPFLANAVFDRRQAVQRRGGPHHRGNSRK